MSLRRSVLQIWDAHSIETHVDHMRVLFLLLLLLRMCTALFVWSGLCLLLHPVHKTVDRYLVGVE